MAEMTLTDMPSLRPLPYHQACVNYLKAGEPDIWAWACSGEAREEHAQAVRAELLRNTYRLDAQAHPQLHEQVAAVAARLGITAPITLYQANDGVMNASLFYLPREAHVVFSGPVLERLKGAELEAVLGHELAHHVLWDMDGGAYHAADRVLTACAHDPRASTSHLQAARLFRLYTEVFADRGGAIGCGGLDPAVVALVKTQTGLSDVSASSYLKQADEICAAAAAKATDSDSHPEHFIRARALRLWCEKDPAADDWLQQMLQGPLALDTLDLIGQLELTDLTRRLLAQALRPRFLRSDGLLAHARKFFPDFRPDDGPDDVLDEKILKAKGTHEYVAALLMDLAVADSELDDVPMAASLEMARRLGLEETFEKMALRDLRLPKRQFTKLKKEAADLLEKAGKQHG